MNYQPLYTLLFNAITDALAQLSDGHVAAAQTTLIRAQQATEELYLSSP